MPDERLAARFRLIDVPAEPDPGFAERLYALLVTDAAFHAPVRQPARLRWYLVRWIGLDEIPTEAPALRYLRLMLLVALLAAAAMGVALVGSYLLTRSPVEEILQRSMAVYDDLPPFTMVARAPADGRLVRVRSDGAIVRWDLVEGTAWGIGPGSFILTTKDGRRSGWMTRSGAWEEWVGEWPAATDLHLMTWLARNDAGDVTAGAAGERETCPAWADGGEGTLLGRMVDIVACGARRWWVDRATGLVLRYADGTAILEEAMELDLEPALDAAVFALPASPGPTTPRVASAVPTPTPAVTATPHDAAPSPTPSLTVTPTLSRAILDGDGAFNPVIALRHDDRPVIASFLRGTGGLRVVSCADPDCRQAPVIARLPSSGYGLDLALSSTGLPVLAVAKEDGSTLLLRCRDEACVEGASSVTLGGGATWIVGVALVHDQPRVVVRTAAGLVVHVCGDPGCDAHHEVVLDPDPGSDPNSIRAASLPDGGIVTVYALASGEVRLAGCRDPSCDQVGHLVLDSGGHEQLTAGIAVADDGSIVVPYYHSGTLRVARCTSVACDDPSISRLDQATQEWWAPIGVTLQPRTAILYWSPTNLRKQLAVCDDAACVAPPRPTELVDSRANGDDELTAIAFRFDGTPVLASERDDRLIFEACLTPTCAP